MHARFIALLKDGGYSQVSVRHDGQRLILEGNVESFDCKVRALHLVRPLVRLPILNCIRVHPA
jgi:hypothetical protein